MLTSVFVTLYKVTEFTVLGPFHRPDAVETVGVDVERTTGHVFQRDLETQESHHGTIVTSDFDGAQIVKLIDSRGFDH